ncbi:hydroxypyruvate isomerase family protein [Paracoccus pacificus]|uniref:Hydroxypyruvate isomerase family protein n=1 Tax=Paracoccus pacificus TaxID=1463598 RepID=A0ABW4R4H8_9RHOB
MPRFAANITWLFTELPILDRPAAARRAGFQAVEFEYPYDIEPIALQKACAAAKVEFAMMITPGPNWSGGPRGFAAVPGGEELFRKDFERALKITRRLGARHINVLSGQAHGPDALDTMLANLRWAVKRAPHASLTIEPISPIERRMSSCGPTRQYLDTFDRATELLGRLNSPNVGLLFDAYHAQVLTEDVLRAWHRHRDQIRHVQISGCPVRNEPVDCAIDYHALFRAIDESAYAGWVSAQYTPATTTEAGLGWLHEWARASAV